MSILIGLRLAIGARTKDILTQFLVESATLPLIGGLLGILAGVIASGYYQARHAARLDPIVPLRYE